MLLQRQLLMQKSFLLSFPLKTYRRHGRLIEVLEDSEYLSLTPVSEHVR
jgi:hypothetical protein